MDNKKIYAISVLFSEGVGIISGLIIKDGIKAYETMAKPPLSPPAIVFPIVWSILYLLMGIGAARIYMSYGNTHRTKALMLYTAQLAFNFFWGIIFFNMKAYGVAYFWLLILLVLVANMLMLFKDIDKIATLINMPYLFWLLFAAYLNYSVWMLSAK